MSPTISNGSVPTVTIQVTLPSALLAENGLSQQEASVELLRAYVLFLYRHDRLSTGKAAKLLGIPRFAFTRMLAEEGIPYLDYTSDELDVEMAVANQWPAA
ncbi:MAG: UPF0175 family protein [Caldilineaceae bacterium]